MQHTETEAAELLKDARDFGLTWSAKTEAGHEYRVVAYTNPYPKWVGADTVKFHCAKCSGTGVVGYGNVTLVKGNREDRFCFDCGGNGFYTRRVSSLRAAFKRECVRTTAANRAAADHAATADQRAREEYEADHDAALAEQARRDALPKGFVAEVGERFRDLAAEVVTNYQFESEDHFGRPTTKSLVVFKLADGRLAKWSTGCRGEKVGQAVTLTATVKAHDSYQGQDQTVITRAVVK